MGSYLVLKPLCDDVVRSPSGQAISALREAISTITPDILQHLQDYVLLPLITQVDSDPKIINAELKVQLFDTIRILLQRTQLRQLVRFKVLLVVVLKQIFDPARMCMLSDLSEELKLAAIQCAEQLFRALNFEVRTEFYAEPASNVQLAQVVFMALHLVEHDRYRQIRLAALALLQTVFNVHAEADGGDLELREAVADRVFTMLPKCCAVLLHIIDGDAKEPLELKTRAIETLGKYLCLVFEDYAKMGAAAESAVPDVSQFQRLFVAKDSAVDAAPNNVLQNNAKSPPGTTKRSSEWLEAAAQRLHPVFDKLMKLAGHESIAIRLQLSVFVSDLFAVCTTATRKHLDPVLQIAIVLSRDAEPSVASRCQQLLAEQQTGPQAAAYLDQLDALFHRLLITCPRVLATGSDAEQSALLRLLSGVLSGARLRLVLATGDTMERFCTVLLFMVELDDGADGRAVDALRESHQLRALEFSGMETASKLPPAAWRSYKHLRTERLRRSAEELCVIVGRSVAGEAVFEQMMQRMRDRNVDSNGALLVMQLMLSGDGWAEMERAKALLGELMAGAEHWELDVRPVGVEPVRDEERPSDWYEDRTPGLYESAITIRYTDMVYRDDDAAIDAAADAARLSIAEAHLNVQHICLTLETIGTVARTLRHLFQPFLLRSLYRILCKSGSPNDRIRAAGNVALAGIASAFDHADVAQLIGSNFDYVLFAVTMALRRSAECSDALSMLTVLLRYSPLQTLPHWQGIVQTVIEASGRPQHGEHVLGFLQLFRELLEHLLVQRGERAVEEGPAKVDEIKTVNEQKMREQWLEIINASDADPNKDEDDSELPEVHVESEDETDEPAAKPPTETSVQICADIMRRTIHYLPHRTRDVQCLAVDTLHAGFRLLRTAGAASDIVLPLVHTVWQPFVERVRGGDAIVMGRCFRLMLEMSAAALDFMYKRTATDIFPLVQTFLKKAAAESHERIRDSSFERSQMHRLTIALFTHLPDIIRHLDIAESDLNALLDAATPFLHRARHPVTLQRSAREFLLAVCTTDAAAVYVKLGQWRDHADTADNVQWILCAINAKW